MLSALLWGAVAASSLIIGAIAGVVRDWKPGPVGLVLGFGAGALVAGVSFELAEEGFRVGGAVAVAVGLALGAIAFYAADTFLDRRSAGQAAGTALLLGALLDGIPEQTVLGIGLGDGGVSGLAALMLAIFVSNLPEAIGSASDMRATRSRRWIVAAWSAIAVLCAAFTVIGYALRQAVADWQGGINGFAAGALLVMLVGSMIPEATEKAGERAGLAAVLGFALSAGLSLAT